MHTPPGLEVGDATPADCPPTPMQRAMILASERAPQAGIYGLQTICALHHQTDSTVLQQAWHLIMKRHEILRSTFRIDAGGELIQQVRPHAALAWEDHDWRSFSAPQQQREWHKLLEGDRRQGFPLGGHLPWRVILVRTGDHTFTQVWSSHHALLDGRSQFLVLRELFAAYDALRAGRIPLLDEPVPFHVHAEWLRSRDRAGAERFWRAHVESSVAEGCFLADRLWQPHPPEQDRSGRQSTRFSRELTADLEEFARRSKVTLNTMVLGAWALLLSRYSGSSDVVFGATRACRKSSVSGSERIVGPLINTVPFQVKVTDGDQVVPWLQELRRNWLALRPYEHTPLDRIQAWCGASAAKPLFQSLLVYEHRTLHDALQSLGGIWQHRHVEVKQRVDSPLAVAVSGTPELALDLVYDREIFSDPTAERMLGHLRQFLENYLTHQEGQVAQLPMLTPPEREQVVHAWNRTACDYPRELGAHQLFEAVATASPGQPALVDAGRTLAYQEVNDLSNRLARLLREKGAGPEKLVGVCLERSPRVITAILAVLKAGAAFLPLDPNLPRQRLCLMVRESGTASVITSTELAERFSECAAEMLCLDLLEAEVARQSSDSIPWMGTSGNAAYAIYTSGSTGEPKAVLVTHRSLVNHTLAGRRLYGISTDDRRVQFASIGTDFFVAEVFNYLSSGATLVFQPPGLSGSIQDFLRFIRDNRITVTAFPGSYWNQWVHSVSEGMLVLPESLRLVITGMERIDPHLFSIWRTAIGSRVRWFNVYGPAETTCTATAYEAGTSSWEERSFVPIGKPIANTRVYILNRHGNPVPVGVVGELYIGGAGVSRGYLHRPDLTAERFVPDPFPAEGGTMYQTGDLAFYLPDGNIVFAGRIDRQIKIRGFRVELDEIEAVLGRHPAVRQCAVVAREHGGRQILAAYVSAAGIEVADDELRRHLSRELPDYMVPSAFVRMQSLPLTSSGKVDRMALPEPPQERPAGTAARLPVSSVQVRLARIWGEILGGAAVGIADSFFELGADSLQATRLLGRIRKEFGRDLAFSDLLSAPTIERMAWILEGGDVQPAGNCLVALQDAGSELPFFCVHGGDGEVVIFKDLARSLGRDRPFYGVQAFGGHGQEIPLDSVEAMAAQYLKAMRRVQPAGPYFVGGFCLGAFIALEMAIQLRAADQEVGLLAVINTDAAWRDANSPAAGFRRHALHLLRLSPRRKLRYLLARAVYRLSRIRGGIRDACYQAWALTGSPPPVRLHRYHARELLHRAGVKYMPHPYVGKITCFHGAAEPEIKPADFWYRISQGGIEIRSIPGEGLAVLRPPHVWILAERLNQAMNAGA